MELARTTVEALLVGRHRKPDARVAQEIPADEVAVAAVEGIAEGALERVVQHQVEERGSSAAFFALVLSHTLQGTFGDPYYGGNANFIGWDLSKYPGVRTMVSASDQKQLEANGMKPNHKSAYDYESFTKAR